MKIRSRLGPLLKEKHMTRAELQRRTGLHKRVITRLFADTWEQIGRQSLEAVCKALDIHKIGDLIELYDANIFYSMLGQRKVTIYFGAQTELENEPATGIVKLSQGIWDTRAAFYISNHLRQKSPNLEVQYEIVISRPSDKINYDYIRDTMRRIESGGNHIIIGSPFSNILTEYVLCSFYKARPLTPEDQARIPYRFVYTRNHWIPSTLGFYTNPKRRLQPGIYSERKSKVIAFKRFVTVGEGMDCGIIACKRHRSPGTSGFDNEGVILVLAGYSGTATLGAARLAVDRPGEIFPERLDDPLTRVISVKYTKLSRGNFDDRSIEDVWFES